MVLAFFVCGTVQIHSIAERGADRWHSDEWHTLMLGSQYLFPVNSAYTVRVGEANRWFVRLLYPFAIYYMNTRMGNDWELEFSGFPGYPGTPESAPYDGWTYPGGYYLKKNFNDAGLSDPNVQDFIIAMRFMIGIIALLTFSLVIWGLFRRAGLAASASYSVAILTSSLVFDQFNLFYTETVLFILTNCALFLFLSFDRPGIRISALSGIVSGAALSTKLVGVSIAAFMFFYIVMSTPKAGAKRVIVFLVSVVICFAAINLFVVGSYFDLVNETLVNVWNYLGRHMTERTRVETISLVAADLGIPIIVLFVFAILWLGVRPRRIYLPVYVLGVASVLILYSLVGGMLYLSRNIAPIYVWISFIVALAMGDAAKHFIRGRAKRGKTLRGVLAVSLVSIVGFAVLSRQPASEDRFFEENAKKLSDCGDLAVLGLRRDRVIAATGRDDARVFENFTGPFISSGGSRWYEEYTDWECVIVKRKGQNKHISNYFLPISHDLSDRDGRFFFYIRKRP